MAALAEGVFDSMDRDAVQEQGLEKMDVAIRS